MESLIVSGETPDKIGLYFWLLLCSGLLPFGNRCKTVASDLESTFKQIYKSICFFGKESGIFYMFFYFKIIS